MVNWSKIGQTCRAMASMCFDFYQTRAQISYSRRMNPWGMSMFGMMGPFGIAGRAGMDFSGMGASLFGNQNGSYPTSYYPGLSLGNTGTMDNSGMIASITGGGSPITGGSTASFDYSNERDHANSLVSQIGDAMQLPTSYHEYAELSKKEVASQENSA